MNILTIIVAALFISLIYNLILKRFHISPIVGYIFTGITMVVFIDITTLNKEDLSHVAEFGIVFLMFTIGLEFSVSHLKSMKKEVFTYGLLQVLITSIIFTYISYLIFNLDMKTSIVIGTALSLSSTAIVLKVLNTNGDIHRPYGRNSVGILIFQDIAVVPILIMITILSDSSASIPSLLFNTLISAIGLGILLYLLGKYAMNRFLSYVVESKTEELFILAILFIVLSSALLAHSVGFSYSLGAFAAGMLIAETKYKWQIEADLVPFRDILLGIFFITIGMQVNFDVLFNNIFVIIALAIGILALKVVIIFALIRMFTFTKRAIKTALTLAQVGEFSFAVFALASANGLIDDKINQIMVPVVIISLIFTSLALRYVRAFVDFFMPEKSEALENPIVSEDIKEHIIVCGYSLLGQKIVKKLKNSNFPYLAIEHNSQYVKLGKQRDDVVFFGNASSKHILNSLYVQKASVVIIAIDNDEKIRLICSAIRELVPDMRIILKVKNQAQIDELADLNIDKTINENEIVAEKLIEKATKCNI